MLHLDKNKRSLIITVGSFSYTIHLQRREERSSTTLRHKHRKRSRDSKHDRRRGRASDSSSSDGEGGGHKDNRLRTKRTHQEALTTSGGPVKLSEYLNS